MKTAHIAIAIVLIIAGIAIAITGWNGMANVADNPTVVQEKQLSITDRLAQKYEGYSPTKPANPLAVPIGEVILGLIAVSGGLYLAAGELKLIPSKTKSGH